MRNGRAAWAALVVAGVLAAGCGGDDGLSREEVDAEIADAVAGLPEPSPGLGAAEVEEAVGSPEAQDATPDAAAGGAQPDPESAGGEAAAPSKSDPAGGEAAAPSKSDPAGGEAAAPSKSDPAAYTRHVVAQAVALYEDAGLDAALAHFNSADSVDGEWYVFVIDQADEIVGHHDPSRLGEDMGGWVGTDINGYSFGLELLSATEDGKWVSYVYANPAADADAAEAFQLKHVWAVRHDGLLFASGWYISTEDLTPALVAEAVEQFRTSGLAGTVAHFADPSVVAAGLREAVDYYNAADTADGKWLAFIAGPDGAIVGHNDPAAVGTDIEALLGPALLEAPPDGAWFTAGDNPEGAGPDSMRIWAASHDGYLLGAGWYQPRGG